MFIKDPEDKDPVDQELTPLEHLACEYYDDDEDEEDD